MEPFLKFLRSIFPWFFAKKHTKKKHGDFKILIAIPDFDRRDLVREVVVSQVLRPAGKTADFSMRDGVIQRSDNGAYHLIITSLTFEKTTLQDIAWLLTSGTNNKIIVQTGTVKKALTSQLKTLARKGYLTYFSAMEENGMSKLANTVRMYLGLSQRRPK